ncbi:MAG: ABC transporter substrate-binding protein, partial [Chloroflexota bacterium]|nr:ABC transporter substrate-binding protein [Chloroflexota bacterium]
MLVKKKGEDIMKSLLKTAPIALALVMLLTLALVGGCTKEVPKEVVKEVPVKIVTKEVVKEVPVEVEKIVEVMVEAKTVTIVDGTGKYVEVPFPAKRIVALAEGKAAELICLFGEVGKIAGRDALSTFPSYLQDVPEVAGSSYNPNVELLLEVKPDVVIAGTMLNIVPGIREKIEAAGVAVVVDSPGNPDRLIPFISNLGIMLDQKEKAQEIIEYMEQYQDLVEKRIKTVAAEDRPTVFFEWRSVPYNGCSAQGIFHKTLVDAGAINIAAGEAAQYPKLSPEWVYAQDPDIIIRSITHDLDIEGMKQDRQGLMERQGLSALRAVEEGNVYIANYAVTAGLRYHIGLLAFAKWCHPDLFCDIDLDKVYQDTVEKFFGAEEWQKLDTVSYYPMSRPTCEEPDLPESGMPGGMPGSKP